MKGQGRGHVVIEGGATLSGKGPSVAAIVQEKGVGPVLEALCSFRGKLMVVKVNNERARTKAHRD